MSTDTASPNALGLGKSALLATLSTARNTPDSALHIQRWRGEELRWNWSSAVQLPARRYSQLARHSTFWSSVRRQFGDDPGDEPVAARRHSLPT